MVKEEVGARGGRGTIGHEVVRREPRGEVGRGGLEGGDSTG